MKTLFEVILIALLFQNIRSDGCEIKRNKMVCTHITLEPGKPLPVEDGREIKILEFHDCNLPTIPSGVFTNLQHVTLLKLDSCKVASVEPKAFESMTNLEELYLNNNLITEIEDGTFDDLTSLRELRLQRNLMNKIKPNIFDSLTKLEVLDISYNKLTEADNFDKNTNLKKLFLNDNKIKEIKWKNYSLAKLRILHLYSNEIANIDPKSFNLLKNLNQLRIDRNQLVEIQPETLKLLYNLEVLDLSYNKLTEAEAFKKNTNLKKLFLNDNKIKEINWKTYSLLKLGVLHLYSNEITNIDPQSFNSLTNLNELRIDRNQLAEIHPETFKLLLNLEVLDLSYNKLTETDSFEKNINLKKLFLNDNKIKEINWKNYSLPKLELLHLYSNEIANIDPQSFNSLTNLNELRIDRNQLVEIHPETFKLLLNLEVLDLSYNKLTEVVDFEKNTNLKKLFLNDNKIKEINWKNYSLPKLEVLHLYSNEFTNIDPQFFNSVKNLIEFRIDHNQLIEIHPETFKLLLNLEVLDLSYNNLTEAEAFEKNVNLKKLFLNDNKIKEIKWKNHTLPKLEVLHLYSNEFTNIDPQFFNSVKNLIKLRIDHNHLTEIHPETFKFLLNLEVLDLSYNNLTDAEAFENNTNLKKVFLNDNKIKEIKWKNYSLPKLEVLHLYSNEFTNIDPQFFNSIKNLIEFRIDHNQLIEIHPETFKLLSNLEVLDLSYNNLTEAEAFEKNVNLKKLFLNDNKIKEIKWKNYSLPKLEVLHLYSNEFTNIDPQFFNSVKNLIKLRIDHNHLTEIHPETFKLLLNLEVLDLSYNKLIEVDGFEKNTNLKKLLLNDNKIKEIKWINFSLLKLEVLHLHSNEISNINPQFLNSVRNLIEFRIDHNRLVDIDPETFKLLLNLEVLDLSYNKLIEADGFEKNTNLKKLFLNDNNIKEIKWENYSLPKLEVLHLYSNKIANIDPQSFNSLTNLNTLRIDRNQLVEIQLETLKLLLNLEVLGLSYNKLTEAEGFEKTLNLKKLYLNDNKIEEIKWKNYSLPKLEVLHLYSNEIANIDPQSFNSLKNLNELLIDHNRLVGLHPETFKLLFNLEVLNLSYNKLTEAGDFEKNTNLKKLFLNDNKIKEINWKNYSLPKLEVLHLYSNEIATMDPQSFNSLTNLNELRIDRNQLVELHPETFKLLLNLEVLDLSYNKLTETDSFENNINLKKLFLNDNKIKEINWKNYSLPKLEVVHLYSNEIADIDPQSFNSLKNLKELDMNYNKLVEVHPETFNGLFHLEVLELQANDIEELKSGTFNSLINLRELLLKSNKIKDLEFGIFASQINLRKLMLSNNYLSTLPEFCFANLTSLQTLRLDHNTLKSIPEHVFDSLINLETLRLDHNDLTAIPDLCFNGTSSLKQLYLNNNYIEYLDVESLLCEHHSLANVSLDNNGWNCHQFSEVVKKFVSRGVFIRDGITTGIDGITCDNSR